MVPLSLVMISYSVVWISRNTSFFNAQDAGKGDGKHGVSGHEMQL